MRTLSSDFPTFWGKIVVRSRLKAEGMGSALSRKPPIFLAFRWWARQGLNL
jgi:hypothetical protein